MAQINWQSITIKIAKSPKLKLEALKRVDLLVKRQKQQLLEEFDNHIVTQELESGPDGSNLSGTLNSYGNLFSFIGFNSDDRPTQLIRTILNKNIGIFNKNALFTRFSGGNKIEIGFRVQYPSIKELNDSIFYPDGYSAGNLLEDLEKGRLKGLSYFLYDENFGTYSQSRSGTGLQAKRGEKLIKIRAGNTAKKIPYVIDLIEEFARRLRGNI